MDKKIVNSEQLRNSLAAVNELAAGIADTAADTIEKVANASVPTTRTINNKALNADISLSAADVGAAADGHGHSEYATIQSPVFEKSISLGRKVDSSVGERSVAMGGSVEASGSCSHAEGGGCAASGSCSHAEGHKCTAKSSLGCNHAEGTEYIASGEGAHAEGGKCEARGEYSHAEGYECTTICSYSHAQNYHTTAFSTYQTAMGSNNVISYDLTDRLIIGKGEYTPNLEDIAAYCFRATDTGVYAAGSYNASGADYAEMFEWADGNPGGKDWVGRFVTLEGAKIRLADPEDDYIIGIVSGNPSVVGDVHDDQWQGMYLYDVFGRPLWEDIEVPDQIDEDGRVIVPAHTERRQRFNPDYDSSQPYQARSKRPEWDAVGLMGKLVAVDDGSCEVNGWCTVGEGGIAIKAESRTKYRVMERLDVHHIRVLIL